MAKTLANLIVDSRIDKDSSLRTITVDKAKAPDVYDAIVSDEVTLIDSVLLVLIDGDDSEVVVCNKDITYSEAVKITGEGGTPTPVEVSWDDVTDKPSTFAPSAHNQAFTTITGVATVEQIPDLTVAKVTGLQAGLNAKVDDSQVSASATVDTIPLRKSSGRVETGTAVDGADAVNLTQLNTSLEGKLDVGTGTQSATTFRRGDGTWATPPNTTYAVVTTAANGLMSAADKTKLDGVEEGANNYALPAGGTATTYLRGDGTWVTPTNTTYTVITDTEFNTGSATTARSVSAVSLNRDVQAKIVSYLLSLDGAAAGNILTVNAGGDGFEWITLA